jgi:hypothetical protein
MSRGTIDDAALEAEIGQLPALSLLELRSCWKTLFGHPAPKSLRRNFLARAVAYQMQVEAYGGLSVATKRRLREIAHAARTGDANATLGSSRIKPGTQMIRQWQNTTHTVTALVEGFEWNGRTYKSLSPLPMSSPVPTGTGLLSLASSGRHLGTRTRRGRGKPTRVQILTSALCLFQR